QVSTIQESVLDQLGKTDRVICGFSGGVDSTTLATMFSSLLGNRLQAIVIDGGQLRHKELDVIRYHAQLAGVNLRVIEARDQFQATIPQTIIAREKRRRFKKVYTDLFVQAAEEFGANAI